MHRTPSETAGAPERVAATLRETSDVLGLSDYDLWLRYAVAGGGRSPDEVADMLAGAIVPSGSDIRVLCHALNSRLFVELAGERAVPYPAGTNPVDDPVGDLRDDAEAPRLDTAAMRAFNRRFVGQLAHELRTPLAVMIGYAGMTGRPDVSLAQAREFAEAILESGGRLQRSVGLLEFAAMVATTGLSLDRSPVALSDVVREAVARWEPRLPQGLMLECHIDEVPAVEGDALWLARAVDELIDNAVRFSSDVGTIEVRVSRRDLDGPRVQLDVTNQGGPADGQTTSGAFDAFTQGDPAQDSTRGGFGLGLFLVREVVRAHGGSVRLLAEGLEPPRATMLLALGRGGAAIAES